MQKLSKFILDHKIIVISIMVALLIVSCIGLMFIKTNSDIVAYLPSDSPTAIGKDILLEKFKMEGDVSIVLKGVDYKELSEFVENANGKEFISQVAWIGSFDMIRQQLDNPEVPQSDKDILKNSYETALNKFTALAKDGTAIHRVSVYFSAPTSSDEVMGYVDEIDSLMKSKISAGNLDQYAIGGMAVNSRDMLKSSLGEIPIYLVIAVVILSVILLLTTKSWIEPIIFLTTLGVSMLFNMGTNFLFGEISTITYSASTILQLALAMDYSIFLMHCYYDEKKRNPLLGAKDVMRLALPKTLKSITASALTTIGGFIALFAMEFGMGMDLGAVLAKGVFLSLLSVITIQPLMIILLDKPILRSSHKYIKPTLKRTQRFATKRAVPIVIVAILLVIPALIGQFNVPLSYITMNKENIEMTETQAMINDGSNQLIVIAPKGIELNASRHYKFLEQLKKIEDVAEVFSAYSLIPKDKYGLIQIGRPEIINELGKTFFRDGYSLYLLNIKSPIESETCYSTIDTITAAAEKAFGGENVYVTGLGQGAKDLAAVTPSDFIKVSMISALIILIILMLTYKEWLLSFILLFVIEIGIWINLSIVTLSGISINFMSYLIISSVQLGATVDYAILVASKYREAKGEGVRNDVLAIRQAVTKASPSILVSAAVLISVCTAVFFVTNNKIIAEITLLIGAGAAMSTFLVMVLLPAILTLKARLHNRLRTKLAIVSGTALDEESNLDMYISKNIAIIEDVVDSEEKPKNRRRVAKIKTKETHK